MKISFEDYKKYAITNRYKMYTELYDENIKLKNQIAKFASLYLSSNEENGTIKNQNIILKDQANNKDILLKETERLSEAIENKNEEINQLKKLLDKQSEKIVELENTINKQSQDISLMKYTIREQHNKIKNIK